MVARMYYLYINDVNNYSARINKMNQNKYLADSEVQLKNDNINEPEKQMREVNENNLALSQQFENHPEKPDDSEQKIHQYANKTLPVVRKFRIFDFQGREQNHNPNINPQVQPRLEQKNISINQISPAIQQFPTFPQNRPDQKECNFCAELLGQQKFDKSFKCQHIFCKTCLKSYFESQIKSFKIIMCPEQACLADVNSESAGYKNLSNQLRQKYQLVKFRNGIQQNAKLMLCPSQGCKRGFVEIQEGKKNGICKQCNIQYCLACKIKSHSGKCQSFQQILLKQKFKYKRCYGCNRVVQRNQGCPHMTCKCGSQFCYYCGSKWGVPHRCLRSLAGGQLVTDKLNTKLKCLRHQDYEFDSSIIGFLSKVPYYLVCLIFMSVYVSWCLAVLLIMIGGILIGSFFTGYIALLCKLCKDGNNCARIVILLFIIFLPIGFLVGWIAVFIYGVGNIFPKYLQLALSARLFPCLFFC